jgi:hypothetical protein
MRNSGLQLDTIIRIVDVDQNPGAVDWRGRWGDFIATTDLSSQEVDDVAVSLVTRGEATIGGGAAPISRIVVETPAPRIVSVVITHGGVSSCSQTDDGQPLTLGAASSFAITAASILGGAPVITIDGDAQLLFPSVRNLGLTFLIVNRLYRKPVPSAA